MAECIVRIYAELADFLPIAQRGAAFGYTFCGTPSVKDAIEAMGIPHVEVDLIVVDDQPAGFGRLLRGGERIAVYPPFRRLDLGPVARLWPPVPAERRFVLDVHLGRLARYLRLAGFDCLYDNAYDDREIVELSIAENRIVLSRDIGLLKHGAVRYGYWLRSTVPRGQFTEIVARYELAAHFCAFSRCMICNGKLADIHAADARARVPPRVAARVDRFRACADCGRVYWRGSHYDRLLQLLRDTILASAPAR